MTKHATNFFSSYEDLPVCTPLGYKVIKCPDTLWYFIQKVYSDVQGTIEEEFFESKEKYIQGSSKRTSEIMPLHHLPNIRYLIHEKSQSFNEAFCKMPLEPTVVYGIRSYNQGTSLNCHRDRLKTHHICSIVIVDKDLDNNPDWPLDFKDHNGNWHQVYADIGDVIIFEAARCRHGRAQAFQGKWFRNLFVNFKFKNWEYTDKPISCI